MSFSDNHYFDDPVMNLEFLHALTLHGFKGAELGECYAAAARIRDGDSQSWRSAWHDLAVRTEQVAVGAEAAGHPVTARDAYLRAATYYRKESVALPPADPAYRTTLEKLRHAFSSFAALSDPPIERVEIPYQDTSLPGYLLHPARGGPRPTVVIGDNASEGLYYWVGPPAVDRGYNALLVDLPGIGLSFLDGPGFRPDTEVGVGAVIDYLRARDDVDADRIAVYGGGEPGGYIMTRAAAEEDRIAACVVDPLVSDIGPITEEFASKLRQGGPAPGTMPSIWAQTGQGMITFGMRDPQTIRQMQADTSRIACPLLCLNDATDYPELHRQARAALATAPNPGNALRVFTQEDGTRGYRQMDNFALKHRVMFDWLDDVLDVRHDEPLDAHA